MENLSKPYKYQLFDSEKQGLKKKFFIELGITFLLMFLLIFGNLEVVPAIFVGSAISFTTLLMSFSFGYIGLIVAFLESSMGIIAQLNVWISQANEYHFSVAAFIIMNFLASTIIAHEVENNIKRKKHLERMSVTDGLTDIYNHRFFQKSLDEAYSKAARNNYAIALCMIDIDKFKMYNDMYGHANGDEVLKKTAQLIKRTAREGDIVCRYGGDEFSVIFLNASEEDVICIMEKVKEAYKHLDFIVDDDNVSKQLTLSIGFSVFPGLASNKEELIAQADSALYNAKNKGRDRVELYKDVFEIIRGKSIGDQQKIGCLKALVWTISTKDKYTYGHSERVANYAVSIGKAINMKDEELITLQIEGLLHDIGKIEIPDNVLNKRETLTETEFGLLRNHPIYSANIVQSLSNMSNLVEDIKHHHERYDGKGYPDGFGGSQIPIGARVLAIADAFDAMQSDRPYRKALSLEKSVQELVDNSGTQFDPELVKIFIAKLNN